MLSLPLKSTVRACFHGFPEVQLPVHGSRGTVAFHGGWLVEPEVVLANPEWLKHLTHPVGGLLKSLELCFCLIWGGFWFRVRSLQLYILEMVQTDAKGLAGPLGWAIRAMEAAWTSWFWTSRRSLETGSYKLLQLDSNSCPKLHHSFSAGFKASPPINP